MSRLYLLILISCVNCYGKNVSSEAYLEYGIVPNMLPGEPERYLTVLYCGAEVQEGNVLTPRMVKDIPTVSWDASIDEYYIVAMVDNDMPSCKSPTSREWLHWLVVNVPGTNIEDGDTIAEYIGSGPSENSGLHRYVFLVYRQPEKMEFDEPILTNRSAENRSKFSIGNFTKKYCSSTLIAGNFYRAEYDDYVPILYKLLGL